MEHELTAKIRKHPCCDENLHAALIEVIERGYSPERLSVMLKKPVLDSLIWCGRIMAGIWAKNRMGGPKATHPLENCHRIKPRARSRSLLAIPWGL